MIFFPVVNEACRVLGEGIAVKAADLDISSVMGMGFPPYRFVFLLFTCHLSKLCTCSNFGIDFTGEVSYSGLTVLDPSTYIQNWRNGHSCMENSSNLVPTWLQELPKEFLW